MAHKLKIPFHAFRVTLESGKSFLIPLNDFDAWCIDPEMPKLVKEYAQQLQQKVLNKGDYLSLLEELKHGAFTHDKLDVKFMASRDGYSFPTFIIDFDYYWSERERGVWGAIPVLGLESFAENQDTLEERLGESVRFEFARSRRLLIVQHIIAAMWFQETGLESLPMELKVPSLKELDEAVEERPQKLLPQLATPLKIQRQEAFGRTQEITQIINALKSTFNNNVLLVGPSGVGKTTLVWELARVQRKHRIKGQIWETTASALIKELSQDTGWQDHIEYLIDELKNSNDFLFVRNLKELFEVGKYEGNPISLADYLKAALARGDINMITECTEEERAQIELKSPQYISHFQVIQITQPQEDLESIIIRKVQQIAAFQKVKINEAAIDEVLRLNKRFSPYAGLPGKPIRFLENMLINQKYVGQSSELSVGRSDVIDFFSQESGIPRFIIDPEIPMDADQIKRQFNEQLFGQHAAIDQVVDVLTHVKTALNRTEKPIASFLFVGPTGVGKTELAKMLAQFMFGDRRQLTRFDMSEYASSYDIIRLMGFGSQSEGLLTAEVKRNPFTVLLFDEIEKAHSNFYDLLLQILGEGRLSDGNGNLVNFCSAIIIMTSNIGAAKIQNQSIGIQQKNGSDDLPAQYVRAVQKHFRPELFNRIDRVVPFHALDRKVIKSVVRREIALIHQREGLKFREVELTIDDSVYEYLVDSGYNPKYGARQMQRTIRNQILSPLSKALNQQDYDDQLIVKLSCAADEIVVDTEVNPLGFDLLLEELEKFTNSNLVSLSRRQCARMRESHFYTQFLSELDILNQQLKEHKTAFWTNIPQAERYRQLLELKERAQQMEQAFNDLELQLGLSCMNLKPYEKTDKEAIDVLNDQFVGLKKYAITISDPTANKINCTIFGIKIQPFLDMYNQLFQVKGFEVVAQRLWYSEKAIPKKQLKKWALAQKTRNGAYYWESVDASETSLYPNTDKNDFTFCGINFILSGECVKLYFAGEDGAQTWIPNQGEKMNCIVKCTADPIEIPKNIYRPASLQRLNPRRTITPPIMRDAIYRINREFRRNEAHLLLMQTLDYLFEQKIDREIFH